MQHKGKDKGKGTQNEKKGNCSCARTTARKESIRMATLFSTTWLLPPFRATQTAQRGSEESNAVGKKLNVSNVAFKQGKQGM